MANKWLDIFALSQFSPKRGKLPYGGRTVRIVIRNFILGDKVRITLSNRYGNKDIRIDSLTFANCDSEGKLSSPPISLTFNDEKYGVIRAQSTLTSDDAVYSVNSGYCAVSMYFKGKATVKSMNMLREKVIVSDKGDYSLAEHFDQTERLTERILSQAFKLAESPKYDIIPLLECVSISTNDKKNSIIAFGDSITQGGKWSYELAERLNAPVLNLGISGNRLLRDCNAYLVKGIMGEAAIKRFDRDVLTRQGVKAIIILLGTNDIGQPGTPVARKSEKVTAKELIDGLTELAIRSHKAGLIAYVCTHTPFRYFRFGYIGEAQTVRHQVNAWIRSNDVFDGFFDYDLMIQDKDDPERIATPYDSGDHLHPSDAGSVKMLDAVDIDSLRKIVEGDL